MGVWIKIVAFYFLKKNGQVVYFKKLKLNITNIWLIPLDRVTYNNSTT